MDVHPLSLTSLPIACASPRVSYSPGWKQTRLELGNCAVLHFSSATLFPGVSVWESTRTGAPSSCWTRCATGRRSELAPPSMMTASVRCTLKGSTLTNSWMAMISHSTAAPAVNARPWAHARGRAGSSRGMPKSFARALPTTKCGADLLLCARTGPGAAAVRPLVVGPAR